MIGPCCTCAARGGNNQRHHERMDADVAKIDQAANQELPEHGLCSLRGIARLHAGEGKR
jgi:hypothetical protein